MIRKWLLGVDLGTTATKAALYSPSGEYLAEGRADVALHHPEPGRAEQDPEDFYRSAALAIRQCMAQGNAEAVAGIAFDSQMAGIGAVDESFRSPVHFDSWLDMRCQPFIEDLAKRHGRRIAALTGCAPTCNHGPKMMWWKQERPTDYRRIAKFVTAAGYVAGRAAGLRAADAFIDATFLHFTALADAQAGAWSPELAAVLGIDAEKLPRIVEPWDQIGELSAQAARDFGLAEGTPIAAGCGDTAAGALGAGIVRAGMLLDTAGTASVLACCTDRFVADEKYGALMTMRSVIPGIWNPLAYIGGGGLAVSWFREQFADATYDEVLALAAEAAPGAEGLVFSPHLTGRICPGSPAMRGAWTGFSFGHRMSHFSRAVLESVAYEYAQYIGILRETMPGFELREARVIGGGAALGGWNQIKASVLGTPFRRLERAESATWGAAMIAGKSVGLIEDLAARAEEAAGIAPETWVPEAEHRAAYDEGLRRYRHWQQVLQGGFEDE